MARVDADVHGLLIVDKPAGVTSHDIVARTRREFGTRRVGHAGTLDPAATGVLVLGLGKATRLLTYLVGDDKEYEATIRLGQATATDDAEGEVTATAGAAMLSAITDEQIADAVRGLTGNIMQRPSSVSAIKVDGERAYAKVRAGERVELPARPIAVHRFVIDNTERHPDAIDLQVRVHVSSGTYVRALARDLGELLGVGGHLTSLRRTRSGRFSLDDVGSVLIPLGAALSAAMPTFALTEAGVTDIGYGRAVPAAPGAHGTVGLMDAAGNALAIAEAADGMFAPKVVFA